MVLASAYFVVAPVIDDPAIEFLFAFIFIVAGLILYFPFVYFKKELPFMGKFNSSGVTSEGYAHIHKNREKVGRTAKIEKGRW